MPPERLQKILSNAGVSSRREAEALIVEGRVSVNGVPQLTLGARADPDVDEVTVDGVPVLRTRYRYFMLNKPAGFVTTAHDEQGRPTVLDLVPIGDIQLHTVGRLDLDSEGLLILTNDGNLTALLTHPRHEVEKEYLVAIDQPLADRDRQRLLRGIVVDGEPLRAHRLMAAAPPPGGDEDDPLPATASWLLFSLREGRKRQIRRMLGALSRRTLLLRRVRMGPLALGTLSPGAFRELTDAEVVALYAAARPSSPSR